MVKHHHSKMKISTPQGDDVIEILTPIANLKNSQNEQYYKSAS